MPENEQPPRDVLPTTDWTQCHDLAKEQPDKLHELQRLFEIEATKYNVLPLDDQVAERILPEVGGRPPLVKGDRQLLYGGMGRLSENSVVSIKNTSHADWVEIDVGAAAEDADQQIDPDELVRVAMARQ